MGPRSGAPRREGGDDSYRRRDAGEKKQDGAEGGFAPEFRGGFGRGKPAAAQ